MVVVVGSEGTEVAEVVVPVAAVASLAGDSVEAAVEVVDVVEEEDAAVEDSIATTPVLPSKSSSSANTCTQRRSSSWLKVRLKTYHTSTRPFTSRIARRSAKWTKSSEAFGTTWCRSL